MVTAVLAAGLLAACSTSFTATRLSPSFAAVFTAAQTAQQSGQGRTDVYRDGAPPSATCRRTGPAASGAGEDWTCTVGYVDLSVTVSLTYDLQLRPDGCWVATGPPVAEPARVVDPVTSRLVDNPLAVLEGCQDTSWG